MRAKNVFEFKVEFFTNRHSMEKIVTLTPEETANLFRWTYRLPPSAAVDLGVVTASQFEDMTNELAYQYLCCYLGDPEVEFDPSLLSEWVADCWGA